jgi:hypothetical protein
LCFILHQSIRAGTRNIKFTSRLRVPRVQNTESGPIASVANRARLASSLPLAGGVGLSGPSPSSLQRTLVIRSRSDFRSIAILATIQAESPWESCAIRPPVSVTPHGLRLAKNFTELPGNNLAEASPEMASAGVFATPPCLQLRSTCRLRL